MQFGTAAWGFRETPLPQQLKITRDLGLSLLELGIAGHPNDQLQLNATEAEIAEVKSLFNQYEVPLSCASTGNDFTQPDEAACLVDLENMKKTIGIAAQLGVSTLRVFAGFSPVEEVTGTRWERMILCLNSAAIEANRVGVTLAVETHGGVKSVPGGIAHFQSTSTQPETIDRWLNEVSPKIQILFDPANLGAVGLNETQILALYKKLEPRISAFHLKDFKRLSPTALEPCACGEGLLDWSQLIPVFREFQGPGFIEYEMTADIADGLKRTLLALV